MRTRRAELRTLFLLNAQSQDQRPENHGVAMEDRGRGHEDGQPSVAENINRAGSMRQRHKIRDVQHQDVSLKALRKRLHRAHGTSRWNEHRLAPDAKGNPGTIWRRRFDDLNEMYDEMVQASRTVVANSVLSTTAKRGHEISGAVALMEAQDQINRYNMRILDICEELREYRELLRRSQSEQGDIRRHLDSQSQLTTCLRLKLEMALGDRVNDKLRHDTQMATLEKQLRESTQRSAAQHSMTGEMKTARYWQLETERARALLTTNTEAFRVHKERTLAREEARELHIMELRQEIDTKNEVIQQRDVDLDSFGIEIKEQYELLT